MTPDKFMQAVDFAKQNPDDARSKEFAKRVFSGNYNSVINQSPELIARYEGRIEGVGQPEKKEGFLGRAIDRIRKGVGEQFQQSLELEKQGKQGRVASVLQGTGSVIGEGIGGTAVQAVGELADMATRGKSTEAVETFMQSPFMQNVGTKLSELREKDPVMYENAEAVLNLLDIPIASVAGKGITRATVRTLDDAREVVPDMPSLAILPQIQASQAAQAIKEVGSGLVERGRQAIARIPENIEASRLSREEFNQLPQNAQEAVRLAGDIIPQKDIARIVNTPEPTKDIYREMVKKAKEYSSTGKGESVSDFIGGKVASELNALKDTIKETGEQLRGLVSNADGVVAKARKGDITTGKEINREILNMKLLERLSETPSLRGMKIENGKLDLSNTRVGSELSKGVRNEIQSFINPVFKMRNAQQLHAYRQELFDRIKNKLVKGDLDTASTQAQEAIRKALSDVLDESVTGYKELNSRLANAINVRDDLVKRFKFDLDDADLVAEKAGAVLRRLTSNAPSKSDVAQVLRNLKTTLKDSGKSVENFDFGDLQEFTNTLSKVYDLTNDTSLAGIMRDVPLTRAAAGGSLLERAAGAVADALPVKESVATAQKAIDKLLLRRLE